MSLRVAFVGFRHGHIYSLLAGLQAAPGVEVVAACEGHAATRAEIAAAGRVRITHDDAETMLEEVECDIVAIGDVYAKRGRLAIRALERGRHVISDKPLCTALAEMRRIDDLVRTGGLCVGMQLDLRSNAPLATMRRLLREGTIGEVVTVAFSGQHPLKLGGRPAWYFEPGCHGGTINDIAIHGIDAIGWLAGRSVAGVVAARAWNAKTPQFPHFQDCAQMLLRLDNGGGVLGDVSYLAPDGCGYAVPQYWRFLCHGTGGFAETHVGDKTVMLAAHGDKAPRLVPVDAAVSQGYLHDFLAEVNGQPKADGLTTAQVLEATRVTLTIQAAADGGEAP